MASAYVQGTSAGATAHAASSVNVSFGSSVTAGNHIVVDGAAWDGTTPAATVSSVADNKGNGNYTSGQEQAFGSFVRVIEYYKNNVTTGGTSFTVTITWSKGTNSSISIHEYSGVGTGAPTTTSNTGTGTAATSGAVAPSGNNMYHGVAGYDGGASSIVNNSPWNNRSVVDSANGEQDHAGQDKVATSGSQNGSWTIGASRTWGAVICAYPDGGPTPISVTVADDNSANWADADARLLGKLLKPADDNSANWADAVSRILGKLAKPADDQSANWADSVDFIRSLLSSAGSYSATGIHPGRSPGDAMAASGRFIQTNQYPRPPIQLYVAIVDDNGQTWDDSDSGILG